MGFDFDEYEKIARQLFVNTDEGSIRTAISRAYYSIYHKARILLGIPRDRYVPHEAIINQIRDSAELNEAQKLAMQIDKLKQDRVYADYYRDLPRPLHFNKLYLDGFWKRYDIVIGLINEAGSNK